MKKKGVSLNPNRLPNGDNQLMMYVNGVFVDVPNSKIITSKGHQNFLITCEYGDWSPFLTWEETVVRVHRLEKDYPPGAKPNFFFRVVERL